MGSRISYEITNEERTNCLKKKEVIVFGVSAILNWNVHCTVCMFVTLQINL